MADRLCLDANVVFKLYVPEPGSADARELVGSTLEDGGELIGPSFLTVEVLSTIRKHAHRGTIPREQAEEATTALLKLPIREASGPEVCRRAWEIAEALKMPTIYDAVYLAVAELEGAVFWTADRKLFELSRGRAYVHLIGGA